MGNIGSWWRDLLLAASHSWKLPLLHPVSSPSCANLCSETKFKAACTSPAIWQPLDTQRQTFCWHWRLQLCCWLLHTMVLRRTQGSPIGSPTVCKSQPSVRKLLSLDTEILKEQLLLSTSMSKIYEMASLHKQEIYNFTPAVLNQTQWRGGICPWKRQQTQKQNKAMSTMKEEEAHISCLLGVLILIHAVGHTRRFSGQET